MAVSFHFSIDHYKMYKGDSVWSSHCSETEVFVARMTFFIIQAHFNFKLQLDSHEESYMLV